MDAEHQDLLKLHQHANDKLMRLRESRIKAQEAESAGESKDKGSFEITSEELADVVIPSKEELQDLHVRFAELTSQLEAADQALRQHQLSLRKAEATLQELTWQRSPSVPAEHAPTRPGERPVYKQVGHIFLRSDPGRVHEDLQAAKKRLNEELPRLETKQSTVKQRYDELNRRLRGINLKKRQMTLG